MLFIHILQVCLLITIRTPWFFWMTLFFFFHRLKFAQLIMNEFLLDCVHVLQAFAWCDTINTINIFEIMRFSWFWHIRLNLIDGMISKLIRISSTDYEWMPFTLCISPPSLLDKIASKFLDSFEWLSFPFSMTLDYNLGWIWRASNGSNFLNWLWMNDF